MSKIKEKDMIKMAQSFQSVSPNLNEAERYNWTEKEYQKHNERGYQVDRTKTHLNSVLLSTNGMNERQYVNHFFRQKMIDFNNDYIDSVKRDNEIRVKKYDQLKKENPNTKEKLHKKSIDKRRLYAVGKYENTGKKMMPYDRLKQQIMKGNEKGKSDQKHVRNSVLTQYIVGFGNDKQWKTDRARRMMLTALNSENTRKQELAKRTIENNWVRPFLKEFHEKNKHQVIVQAVVQYDETHPHLHLTTMPYVPNDELEKPSKNGLGSVSFTKALKKDGYDPRDVGQYYRDQHNQLREILQKPIKGATFSIDGKRKRLAATLESEEDRPGSHEGMPVNAYNKRQEDLNKQQADIDRQIKYDQDLQKKNAKTETALKGSQIAIIKQLDPDSEVPLPQLPKGTVPKPIKEPEGEKQHRIQPLDWLRQRANNLIQNVLEAARKAKERLEKARKKEENNAARKRKLDQRENNIEPREQDLNRRETVMNETTDNLKKNLKINKNRIQPWYNEIGKAFSDMETDFRVIHKANENGAIDRATLGELKLSEPEKYMEYRKMAREKAAASAMAGEKDPRKWIVNEYLQGYGFGNEARIKSTIYQQFERTNALKKNSNTWDQYFDNQLRKMEPKKPAVQKTMTPTRARTVSAPAPKSVEKEDDGPELDL